MKPALVLGPLFALALVASASLGAAPLPRSSPEAQGVSSARLLEAVDALDTIDSIHSLMVVRHGKVVAEGWWAPYDAASPHVLFSLSKSFASTAVGLAVAEGKLSVDDPVLRFFPDDAPAAPSAQLRAMRVRDLLTMSTGHQDEPPVAADVVSARSFLAQPVPHKPGTHFKYNTAATFMQSAIVQKTTGQTVFDYLQPRLFEPLGITGASWATNFQGISLGGYGLKVRTEDIAKFGQLYLQHGRWNGRQLIPSAWVAEATAKQTSNGSNPDSDWDQGYGYQFWRCRHDGYRGDGAFGQYCIVLPEQDAVVAITSGVKDMPAVLSVVWDTLLPAFQPKRLRADSTQRRRLEARLAGLSIRLPQGAPASPKLGGVMGRTYVFPENPQKLDSLTLRPNSAGPGWMLALVHEGRETMVPVGSGEWKKGRMDFAAGLGGAAVSEPVAAAGAWENPETLVIKACLTETPFIQTWRLRFDGDTVVRDVETNVGFGPTRQPTLTGKAR